MNRIKRLITAKEGPREQEAEAPATPDDAGAVEDSGVHPGPDPEAVGEEEPCLVVKDQADSPEI